MHYLGLNEIQESGAITLANNLKYIPRLEILNLSSIILYFISHYRGK